MDPKMGFVGSSPDCKEGCQRCGEACRLGPLGDNTGEALPGTKYNEVVTLTFVSVEHVLCPFQTHFTDSLFQ